MAIAVRTLASKSLYGPRMHVRAAAVPGDDNYSVVEHKPKPNPNADGVVQRYKYDPTKPDGKGEFIGTMPAFPQGWDDWQNTKDNRPKEEEEEETMAHINKKEAPPKEELLIVFESNNYKIDRVAKHYGTSWAVARRWLLEHEIINNFNTRVLQQTPAPEPVQVAAQEPVQMPQEPATESITNEEPIQPTEKYEPAGYCRGTVTTADGETYPIGDWSPQDEGAIPYKPVEAYDLTDVKLTLIQTILGAHVPGKIALEMIGQIKDMEVA